MLKKKYVELIWYKALAELKSEAARAYMGFLWWIFEPLLYVAAFYIAFGSGIRGGGPQYLSFLLCGLVPWKWFASTVQHGSNSIQINSGLIQQVYIPKYVLPWIVMVVNFIKFLILLGLLLILLASIGHPASLLWLALLPVIVAQFMVIAACASLLAALIPLFPDLKLVVDNGIIALMFFSGVFFYVDKMPPREAAFLQVNPMVTILQSYRNVLLKGEWPDWRGLAWCVIFSLIVYIIADAILEKYDKRYIKMMIG